jgi:DeoR/GlpR family transcriptional regulator of sugar metabolism
VYSVSVIAAQRRQLILETVHRDGAVSIRALAELLDTSAVTIRRDLDYLDSIGRLTRSHGGAVSGQPLRESPWSEKVGQAAEAKAAIGRAAAELVGEGDVVVIGPGTTTAELARALAGRAGLTVFTNSLLVADILVDSPGNEVVVTGGTLRAGIRALVGDGTTRMLRGLHADFTFLSGNGIDPEFGVSTPNLTVAESDRAMAAAGHQVVALLDHTKFGERAAIQTLSPSAIDRLITDQAAPLEATAALSAAGIDVTVVP